jgi:hypothetical protein
MVKLFLFCKKCRAVTATLTVKFPPYQETCPSCGTTAKTYFLKHWNGSFQYLHRLNIVRDSSRAGRMLEKMGLIQQEGYA